MSRNEIRTSYLSVLAEALDEGGAPIRESAEENRA
jgi:hypothetical protein